MNLHCLTRYDDQGASSRVRFGQFQAALSTELGGLQWKRQSLLDLRYLQGKYAGHGTLRDTLRGYLRRAIDLLRWTAPDLRWVEKELWPYAPAWLERLVLAWRPYVLDLDDAIFHNYDRHRLALVRWMWGRKIDRLMRGAVLVTAGNAYLAQRAVEAGARRVEIVPTVIDLDRYLQPKGASPNQSAPTDIVWIGTPATRAYLLPLAVPLQLLAARQRVRLVVIGAAAPEFPGVEVVSLPWTVATEAADIASCQIGIMPLPDSPWERGKCGYKLIQYMACGLPVVASPVGANCNIVRPGHNGMLATDSAQWLTALEALVSDGELRRRLGCAGRDDVERQYSVQALAPRLATLLRQAAVAQ